MKKKITNNLGLKAISFFLAVLLWFFVSLINDPQETRTYYNVPVELINTELLEQQNKFFEVADNSNLVTVRVRIPKSMSGKLRASDIVAIADVSKLTEINTIPIDFQIRNSEVEQVQSIRGDREFVTLNVEELQSTSIRVLYNVTGTPAENHKIISTGLDQNMMKVTGPRSDIERISYASVTMNVEGATTQMSMNIEPVFYDVNGQPLELPRVERNVSNVLMTVEILAVKDVPIVYTVTGTPAEGYLATGETKCNPEKVTIAGTEAILKTIDNIQISGDKLDMTGLEENMVRTVNIKEFLNTRNVRPANSSYKGDVTIVAYIEPKVEKACEVKVEKLTLVNAPAGYKAELADHDPYILRIAGLDADVTEVQNDIRGTVDFSAWMRSAGIKELTDQTYHVPVTFSLPSKVEKMNDVSILVNFVKEDQAP
ncbi:MAG: CdaR family protein [Acetatifactor sp.]|nr:CdaR family protein [Acetatifactor sp.]